MNIATLRRETAEDHQAVEGTMPLMTADLTSAVYVRCLDRVYGIVAAWEERARSVAPEWLREPLAARKRLPMLASDLAFFDSIPSPARASLPPLDNLPHLLGAMYVMEGSTLGGQLIARHVEKCLNLKPGVGDAFFLGHGDQTGRMWKDFCSILDTQVSESDAVPVVQGAKAMFRTFREWMQGIPAPIDS